MPQTYYSLLTQKEQQMLQLKAEGEKIRQGNGSLWLWDQITDVIREIDNRIWVILLSSPES
mgnify:CR=1 FL=1